MEVDPVDDVITDLVGVTPDAAAMAAATGRADEPRCDDRPTPRDPRCACPAMAQGPSSWFRRPGHPGQVR
jgi:hypothetical protein